DPVDGQAQAQRLRVWDLVRGDDHRPHRTASIQALAIEPPRRSKLQASRPDIIDDRVAEDVVERGPLLQVPPATAADYPQLDRPVEARRQSMRVADCLVRPDDARGRLREIDRRRRQLLLKLRGVRGIVSTQT